MTTQKFGVLCLAFALTSLSGDVLAQASKPLLMKSTPPAAEVPSAITTSSAFKAQAAVREAKKNLEQKEKQLNDRELVFKTADEATGAALKNKKDKTKKVDELESELAEVDKKINKLTSGGKKKDLAEFEKMQAQLKPLIQARADLSTELNQARNSAALANAELLAASKLRETAWKDLTQAKRDRDAARAEYLARKEAARAP